MMDGSTSLIDVVVGAMRAVSRRLRLAGVGAALVSSIGVADAAVAGPSRDGLDVAEQLADRWISGPPAGFAPDPRQTGPVDGRFAVGYRRVFLSTGEHPPSLLAVVLWDPASGGYGAEFLLAAMKAHPPPQSRRFDAAAVAPGAVGFRVEQRVAGESLVVHTVVVRRAPLVWEVSLAAPKDFPPAAVASELRDLLERQIWLSLGWESSVEIPQDAEYLERFVLERGGRAPSGHGFVLLPGLSGVLTAENLCRPEVRRETLDGTVFGPSGERMRGICRRWADPVDLTVVTVGLVDLGSGSRAGAWLQYAGRDATALAQDPGIFLSPIDGIQPGIHGALATGRQGRFYITASVLGHTDRTSRRALTGLATSMLVRQRQRLPAGATHPLAPPSLLALHMRIHSAVLIVLGALAALRLLGGRWARSRVRLRPGIASSGPIVSVAEGARRLRRTGAVMGVIIIVALSVALGSVIGPTWKLPIAAVGLAVVPATVLMRRRAERPERWARVGFRRPRLLRSGLLGSASVGLIVVAGGLVVSMSSGMVVGDNLYGADFERRARLDADWFSGLLVLALVLLAGALFRNARRQARLRADELSRFDDRPQVLYLRGFADDRLRIPGIVSGRRPVVELLSPSPRDLFESVVTWELDAAGPSVAIALPGSKLGSLGAARQPVNVADWKERITRQMPASRFIAVTLGSTAGVLWEVSQLRQQALLDRALFLFPPVGAESLQARWDAVAAELHGQGSAAAALPLDAASVLVATIAGGRTRVYTADQRDEAAYRVAIAAALAHLSA
jgi:hypothetical protein